MFENTTGWVKTCANLNIRSNDISCVFLFFFVVLCVLCGYIESTHDFENMDENLNMGERKILLLKRDDEESSWAFSSIRLLCPLLLLFSLTLAHVAMGHAFVFHSKCYESKWSLKIVVREIHARSVLFIVVLFGEFGLVGLSEHS